LPVSYGYDRRKSSALSTARSRKRNVKYTFFCRSVNLNQTAHPSPRSRDKAFPPLRHSRAAEAHGRGAGSSGGTGGAESEGSTS
jgi:hypothetical protein